MPTFLVVLGASESKGRVSTITVKIEGASHIVAVVNNLVQSSERHRREREEEGPS